MTRRPYILVFLPLGGRATALAVAETWEDEQRLREAIVARGDLIPEVAIAVGELLDAAAEGDEAA